MHCVAILPSKGAKFHNSSTIVSEGSLFVLVISTASIIDARKVESGRKEITEIFATQGILHKHSTSSPLEGFWRPATPWRPASQLLGGTVVGC